jgi:outer membrane lipase/esterase
VPIGITLQFNNGNTSGHNWSVAAEGAKFRNGAVTHGPVVGLTAQRISVNGFTETGSFTSLGFGDQTGDSLVSTLGYRASLNWGPWQPFAQLAWNHELADTNRDVTAFLTTIAAPRLLDAGRQPRQGLGYGQLGHHAETQQERNGAGQHDGRFRAEQRDHLRRTDRREHFLLGPPDRDCTGDLVLLNCRRQGCPLTRGKA